MIQLAEKGFDIDTITDPCKLLVANTGNYRYLSNDMYTVIQKIDDKDWQNGTKEMLENIEPYCTHSLPIISHHVYEKVLSFLKAINKRDHSEAAVLLVLNKAQPLKDQQYRIIVPEQEVSGASVDYAEGMKKAYKELKEGEFFAGTIHSHPTFGAHQSGVDKNDEDGFDGIHLTFGLLDRTSFIDLHERFVFAGVTYINKKPINCPDHQISKSVNFPKEWLKKVEAKTYAGYTKSYTYVRPIAELLSIFSTFSPKSKKGIFEPLFEKQVEEQET